MFDQILNLVKEHLGNNPQINNAVPPQQQDAVHREIADHVTNGIKNQAFMQGGVGDLLNKLQGAVAHGGTVTNAIEGGLIGSLASKFGLPPAATGAIAAALPGLLQKFAHKANDPNDSSISPADISKSITTSAGK
jgi:hypothetical protein